jgi:Protein of unknown function (DUF4079)
MYLGFEDLLRLIHPAIAVVFVFPLIGIVVWMAWQTRQRRLQIAEVGKSKIPPVVGQEHVRIGQWLTAAVVGVELLGITRPLVDHIVTKNVWAQEPSKVVLIGLLYGVTISSFVMLYRSSTRLFRGTFATLTGAGVVVLSLQDGIYRRAEEWHLSHLYFGIAVTLLMIFALAILPEIYKDRTNVWRKVHIGLNSIALVLFLAQGLTGTRDLLEIPLSWQEKHIYQCDYKLKTCPPPPAKPG